MEKYKIVTVNFGIEEYVKQFVEEGYIPIGRSFKLEGGQSQTFVHETVLEKIRTCKEKNRDSQKIVWAPNSYYLELEVNKNIENGYIPTGRMYLDGLDYKQNLLHASMFGSLETFVEKVVMEGR